MEGEFNQNRFGQDLAYDLRAVYAHIVGEHLEDVALARKKDNYYNYFKALRDVFIITKHKFKKVDDVIKFERLMKIAVDIANQFSNDWLGISKTPEACSQIEKSLNDIEMFIYEKIDEANIFGSSRNVQGL